MDFEDQIDYIYEAETNHISVAVTPIYSDDDSEPAEHQYAWVYFIKIENNSNSTVQLMNRHWKIVDANGVVQEVTGPGVVGEQPVLEPGDVFEYDSLTSLPTPSGFMSGYYEMVDEDGEAVRVVIPNFSLDQEGMVVSLN